MCGKRGKRLGLQASARQMAQPLDAPPLVDPLGLDELIEEKLDVLVLLANAVGNPLTLLVAILPKVSRRCKVAAKHALATLREVDLSPFRERVTDAAVVAVAVFCPQLTSLNLGRDEHREEITDAAVTAVAARCPQLTSLNLCFCDRITDAAVTAVAAGCPQLTSLNLTDCNQITDAAVTAVAVGCPRLTSLHLRGCKQITRTAVTAVKAGYPQLQIHR